ncbi:hypothetical protein ACQ4WX_04335 [Streptomyces lasalocidi]
MAPEVGHWSAVALIGVVHTLVSGDLTGTVGAPLETSAWVFAIVLTVVFAFWHRRERTLSIHRIDTISRRSLVACGFSTDSPFWLVFLPDFERDAIALRYVRGIQLVMPGTAALVLLQHVGLVCA